MADLLNSDIVQFIGIVLFIAVLCGGYRGYCGWRYETDDPEQASRLTNSNDWSHHDCGSSHLDHNRFDEAC
jgi:hypothetical protein